MVTMVLLSVYIMACLFLYLINMFCGWELIFTFVFAMPIWAYTKRDARRWNLLFANQLLNVVARIVTTTVIGRTTPGMTVPLTMNDELVRQICGIVSLITWSLWFATVGTTMLVTIKAECKKSKRIDELNKSHNIIRAFNLFSVTSVLFIVSQLVLMVGYSMQPVWFSILINIGLTVVVAVMLYILSVNIIRERKEELVEDERDRELSVIGEESAEAEILDFNK